MTDTPPPYDKDLDKILSLTLWGDYQRPDGTWGIGVANREDLKAALQAVILRAQIASTEKCWAQINPADRGWKEVAAIREALQQQLKEVEGKDK